MKIFESEKNINVASGPGESPIKNCFSTIEGLPIGFNCTEGIFASQDSYGFTVIYLILEQEKKVQFFPEQGESLLRKCFSTIEALPIYFHLSFYNIWGQNPYGCRTI